jgi:hypothetical protein
MKNILFTTPNNPFKVVLIPMSIMYTSRSYYLDKFRHYFNVPSTTAEKDITGGSKPPFTGGV